MPYIPGAFGDSDSDSDAGEITFTPPASDKHLSPENKRATNTAVQSRRLLDLEEKISLCMMSMGAIDHEDPDYGQITQRLEALHKEYQKALDNTYGMDDSYDYDDYGDYYYDDAGEVIGVHDDAHTLAKRSSRLNKKVKKWNTIKITPEAPHQLQGKNNDKSATHAPLLRPNVPRTIDELYTAPWTSLTEPEKARLMIPPSQGIDPKSGCKLEIKAAPPASIPTLDEMMKARSAPLAGAATIAKTKNKSTIWADEYDDHEMDQHRGKKWSTVKVRNVHISQSELAGEGIILGELPGCSHPTPMWVDQVSPELKTFEQVQDQMREQAEQDQDRYDPGGWHRFLGIPYGPDAPPYVPPTPVPKAMAITERVEAIAKSMIAQREAEGFRYEAWSSGDYLYDDQASLTAREEDQVIPKGTQVPVDSPITQLADFPQAVRENLYQQFLTATQEPVIKSEKQAAPSGKASLPSSLQDDCAAESNWEVSQDIPKPTGHKKAVDVKTSKKAASTWVSKSPDAFIIDEFAEVTDYIFTSEEAFDILRMFDANLDNALFVFRNRGGAPQLKRMLKTWLSQPENNNAVDKTEPHKQEKASGLEQKVCERGCGSITCCDECWVAHCEEQNEVDKNPVPVFGCPTCKIYYRGSMDNVRYICGYCTCAMTAYTSERCSSKLVLEASKDHITCETSHAVFTHADHAVFDAKDGSRCTSCGSKSPVFVDRTTAKTASKADSEIPENIVVDWGMADTVDESLIWGDPPQGMDDEQTTHTEPDVKEALVTLGLASYDSVDYDTLRDHFCIVVSSCADSPQLTAQIIKAYNTVVNHHDTNDCWRLFSVPRLWTPEMDIKLMTLKTEDAKITWSAVANRLVMSPEECKKRFKAIKPEDWKPDLGTKYPGKKGQKAALKAKVAPKKKLATAQTSGPRVVSPEQMFWQPPIRGDTWGSAAEAPTGDPWSCPVPQGGGSAPDSPEMKATEHAYEHCAARGGDYAAPEEIAWDAPSAVHNKVPQPKAPAPTTYTVSYWATLEHGDQSIHIPIGSNNVCGPEKAIVEGTAGMKKVWKWVQEMGLGDKVSLQDAFDLAKDMHCENEDGESVVNERKATSPVASSRCSCPAWGKSPPWCYGCSRQLRHCDCDLGSWGAQAEAIG